MYFAIIAIFMLLALDPNEFVVMLMPIVVWVATYAANWLKAKLGSSGFSGTVLVTLVVPILSWVAAEIFTLIQGSNGNFWTLFGLGLLGTFVNELVKQWKQTAAKEQTPTKNKLVG